MCEDGAAAPFHAGLVLLVPTVLGAGLQVQGCIYILCACISKKKWSLLVLRDGFILQKHCLLFVAFLINARVQTRTFYLEISL